MAMVVQPLAISLAVGAASMLAVGIREAWVSVELCVQCCRLETGSAAQATYCSSHRPARTPLAGS
jgi:hypothetical protein